MNTPKPNRKERRTRAAFARKEDARKRRIINGILKKKLKDTQKAKELLDIVEKMETEEKVESKKEEPCKE